MKNAKKTQEEVITFYKYPIFKIIDFEIAQSETTSVILLTKIKLMGWSKTGDPPEILTREKIALVVPKSNQYSLAFKNSDCIEMWERPRFQFTEDTDEGIESLCVYNDCQSRPGKMPTAVGQVKPYSQTDLLTGDLAILGPKYLDVLKICDKCKLLSYQTQSRTASFTPPTKNFVKELDGLDVLKNKDKLHFCSCDDENEKFREEFQSKCIVVNQENSSSGKSNKVQCILIGKNSGNDDSTVKKQGKRSSFNGKNASTKSAEIDTDYLLPLHLPRQVQYSHKPTVCERCGVEDINMASCRQCHKVFYCSHPCKRADVKEHATVCRAYITVRRYGEERTAFANKLREPVDGCDTCGFWRDSQVECAKCQQVAFCGSRCEERGKEKHQHVCEAFQLIKNYTQNLSAVRSSEMD